MLEPVARFAMHMSCQGRSRQRHPHLIQQNMAIKKAEADKTASVSWHGATNEALWGKSLLEPSMLACFGPVASEMPLLAVLDVTVGMSKLLEHT